MNLLQYAQTALAMDALAAGHSTKLPSCSRRRRALLQKALNMFGHDCFGRSKIASAHSRASVYAVHGLAISRRFDLKRESVFGQGSIAELHFIV